MSGPASNEGARRRRGAALRAALIALLLAGPSGALADPASPAPADDDAWQFDLALYGWITDITGEARVDDVTIDVEPQLWNDIIRNLDLGVFGGLEARYRGRWILNTDLAFAKISSESEMGPFAWARAGASRPDTARSASSARAAT